MGCIMQMERSVATLPQRGNTRWDGYGGLEATLRFSGVSIHLCVAGDGAEGYPNPCPYFATWLRNGCPPWRLCDDE